MPDCPSGEGAAVSRIAPQPETSNSQQPALSDLSPQDRPWDKHRGFTDAVERLYRGSDFQDYADRMRFCSEFLKFGLVSDEDAALKLKLRSARFCRVRHCPVCQWRRSLMWKAKAYKVLPQIIEKYPSHRWLFLTLTQKTIPIGELRQTLQAMSKAFQRLSQLKAFPAVGWLRSTEVTRGKDGRAHPHFHCLLMVPPSYFSGRNYMKQPDWVEMWRKALRLDYNPVLDVQAVKQGSQPMELVPELLKYCTKESDLVTDRDWFLELTRQMQKLRSINTGGVLKDYLKDLESEPEDLIGESDTPEGDDEASLYFGWKRREKTYRMVSQE